MHADERAETIVKIVAPIGVIVSPIFLYLFSRAPNPEGPDHAATWSVIFLYAVGAFGFFACLYLCRRYWGWFSGKR